jgi:exodeoxyribonuclease III
MKLISWNVNGIRSVYNKGFVEWFTRESPDILCLQETKAWPEQFPVQLAPDDYLVVHSSAQKKGYSGVSTFSREKILDTTNIGKEVYDREGRVLIHELEHFFLLNCYFPNGQRDHNRVPFKLEFCDFVLERLHQLRKKKPVVITGDFNTAHKEIDIANPKSNQKTTGFLPIERAWMDKFTEHGWIDTFRYFHPDTTEAYTWWSQLNPSVRERNIGWRLDYFFISSELIPHLKRAEILPEVRGSDHCPVLIELVNF